MNVSTDSLFVFKKSEDGSVMEEFLQLNLDLNDTSFDSMVSKRAYRMMLEKTLERKGAYRNPNPKVLAPEPNTNLLKISPYFHFGDSVTYFDKLQVLLFNAEIYEKENPELAKKFKERYEENKKLFCEMVREILQVTGEMGIVVNERDTLSEIVK